METASPPSVAKSRSHLRKVVNSGVVSAAAFKDPSPSKPTEVDRAQFAPKSEMI